MLSLLAAAKINLSLKVLGRQADGYHALESLIAFADIGDRLFVKKAEQTSLSIVGPFAASLEGDDNLVMQAHSLLEAETGRALPVEMVLEKKLPVASGLGGGSADAAAALRGIRALYEPDASLPELAMKLGADVPVCLASSPAWMTGIGHDISRLKFLPAADIVLVNPRIAVATGDIFNALNASDNIGAPQEIPPGFEQAADMIGFLRAQGNDLQAPAIALEPQIKDCLAALAQAGAPFHAMSGSGASCFALCSPGKGKALATRYRTLREKDWVMAGRLISAGDTKIDHAGERIAGFGSDE